MMVVEVNIEDVASNMGRG